VRPSRAIGAAVWLQAALVLAIGWFYFWTAMPPWHQNVVSRNDAGHYNLLVRGFLRGHLYLDYKVDPYFATLANPLDPVQRGNHASLPDASYYRGRYYIYYGVSPAMLLFLPFRVLTGRFVSEALASPFFASVGLLASVWLLLAVRRRYFPQASEILVTACLVALGLADMMAILLRRPSFREVPITCGYACVMVALAAIFLALHHRRAPLWLAVASAALGLAVGSRPLYVLACPVVLLPVWLHARERGLGAACWRDGQWRKLALAAAVPLALVGLGLALYNYFRFGSAVEFGLHYQYWNDDPAQTTRFSWRFLAYNLRAYWFAPAGWVRYFPFVTFVNLPPAPVGMYGAEDPYGVLPNAPFALFALGVLALAARGALGSERRLRLFCVAVTLTAAATALPLVFYHAALIRYMVDFAPEVMLLACVGLLAVTARPWFRGAAALAATAAACSLSAYSAAFNVLASIRHNELFREGSPASYAQVAHRLNWLSYAYDRWSGTKYGPVEMKVIFPPYTTSHSEPLVVTGRLFLSDFIFVHYYGPDSLQFGLEHTSRGTLLGPPMRATPGQVHVLRIELGSLYPPAAHPYFDSLSPAEARARQETVRVILDQQVALDGAMASYDAAGPMPSLGSGEDRTGFPLPFSGRILSWRRIQGGSAGFQGSTHGAIRLKLILPPFTVPHNEPLVCTGETGQGDLVYVHYESPTQVSFAYDHWGSRGSVSALCPVDPQTVQTVDIDVGALHPDRPAEDATDSSGSFPGRLLVRLNGRPVLDEPARYYYCDPATVAVGLNPIVTSTATKAFTGEIVESERLPDP